ncbi:beta-ketoacyl synthase N-terminal-like domain-containing protein [Roseibium sp. Sym1]|uniref:beta-ketoacyl synthase N-terminal-like domain-containing protein n=1 Tax=Roseibium sp. Sym1 TaxID=3016006 RepID=UPI0022B30436|nr:beta-ketoacyl synthase N-terminal-like domain-containing protein [Roseibium sp. Sym1]
MKASIVISAIAMDLADEKSLPPGLQAPDESLGDFSLIRLDRGAFEAHRKRERQRHTPVSFRMSQLVTKLLSNAALSKEAAAGAATGLVSGSRYGCSIVFDMHRRLARYGPKGIDAIRFAQATHNYPVSCCAIEFGFKGPCTAMVSSRAAGMEAFQCACDWLLDRRCDRVVVTAFEDFGSPVDDHIRRTATQSGPVFEAMVCLMLERKELAEARGLTALADLTGTAILNRVSGNCGSVGKRLFGRDLPEFGFAVSRSPADFRDRCNPASSLDAGECIGASGLVELAQLLGGGSLLQDKTTPRHWMVGACDPLTGGIAAGIRLH